VHTVVGAAGSVSGVTQAHALLHGDETAVLAAAGSQVVEKRP
jgi:transposase, IS5 family